MAAKIRWSNREPVLRGAGHSLTDDRPQPPSRARVLRGGAELESRMRSLGPVPVERDTARVKAATRVASRPEDVRIEYEPSKYGLRAIETVEEREARHRSEVEDLKARLADAERRIEEASKESYDRGVEAGRSQGADKAREDVEAEYAERINLVVAFLDTIVAGTKDYYARVDRTLAHLGLSIARRVVGDVVDRYDGIALRLAQGALEQASERTQVTLLCHPDDEVVLREAGADFQAVSEGIKEIEVTTSPRVKRGGVILETAAGSIDATIETVLDEMFITVLEEEPPTSDSEDAS